MAKSSRRALQESTLSIPAPFEAAPTALQPLFDCFDPSHVYITHIDKHPAAFKRRIFYVPLAINTVLAALLLWRLYAAYPFYTDILLSFVGNPNDTTIYYSTTPWGELVRKVLWRMLTFLFDWMLAVVLVPWPWTFFCDSAGSPVLWRILTGFRDEEVYVRQSRGWDAEDLLGEAEGSSGKAGGESPFFKTRILPAVDATRLREKTGYMLMDKDFDLDFGAMVTAAQLVDKKILSLADFRTSVYVYVKHKTEGRWAVWNCGRLDDGSETEARKKVLYFRDRLTAMGKETLFFKWVELVQFESSAPGGFTKERQAATAEKVEKLFADEGVDFGQFTEGSGRYTDDEDH